MGFWAIGKVGESPGKDGQGQSGLAVPEGTDTVYGK